MQKSQTIALLGATGKAGKFILNNLFENGYQVKALIRHPDTFTICHPQLTIIQGNAADELVIDQLIRDCHAVISALGQRPGEDLIAALSARNIIKVMQIRNLKRYIFLSGLNLDVPGDKKSEATAAKSVWMRQHYPEAVADKQQAYELVAASDLDWTMIRLPMLEQTDERREVKISLSDSPGDVISAVDLAAFIIGQIDNDDYNKKAPFVAS